MSTRNIVPRANNEGGIGTVAKKWANVWAVLINALTLTAQATGFTISGGTSSKTLTVIGDATISGINSGNLLNGDMVGIKNGSNPTFTFPNGDTPIANSEMIFLDGVKLRRGTGYTIVGGTITMLSGYIPISTSILETLYQKA